MAIANAYERIIKYAITSSARAMALAYLSASPSAHHRAALGERQRQYKHLQRRKRISQNNALCLLLLRYRRIK